MNSFLMFTVLILIICDTHNNVIDAVIGFYSSVLKILLKKLPRKYIGIIFSIVFTVSVLFMPSGTFIFTNLISSDSVVQYLIMGIGIITISILSLFYQH